MVNNLHQVNWLNGYLYMRVWMFACVSEQIRKGMCVGKWESDREIKAQTDRQKNIYRHRVGMGNPRTNKCTWERERERARAKSNGYDKYVHDDGKWMGKNVNKFLPKWI